MLTIIIIVLLFSSLVLVHEWGHFVTARRNGVVAEEFGFGFPPKVWGRVHKGVLYSINLLPLGGFVRMKGEDSSDTSEGSFGAAPYWAKFKILLAGVGMNLITAIVLLYGLCLVGFPSVGSQFEPSFLHPDRSKQLVLTSVGAKTPAEIAGLKRGDIIVSGNGQTFADEASFRNFTKTHAGKRVELKFLHQGKAGDLSVSLRGAGDKGGQLGVTSQVFSKLKYDPLSAVVAAIYITGALFVATIVGVLQILLSVPMLIVGLFRAGVPAEAEAASGPVGIVFILSNLASLGWAYIVLFMANISVALAAFNVLPLPALDGGRLFVATLQKLTRRTWSPDAEARYHGIGFMALIALMILISVYDVRKFF